MELAQKPGPLSSHKHPDNKDNSVSQTNRRADLDGLRGIAIILTLLLHYVSRGGYFPVNSAPEPIFNLLDSFWSGVDIFFVLSGFLIGGILIDNKKASNFFQVFYRRRALRILPIALLSISFSYLLMPLLGIDLQASNQVPAWAYILFINNFWTANGVGAYPPLGPMWSLAIEEQFYLIAPWFILFVGHRKWSSILLLIILASPWLRLTSPWFAAWDFTLYRLDGLAMGMLVAILLREQRFLAFAKENTHQINKYIFWILAIALIFTISSWPTVHQRIALGVSLNSLSAAAIIVYLSLNKNTQLGTALSRNWLISIGQWSYFTYLMHMPILYCVKATGIASALQPLTALAICLASAWGSWKFIESPLISFGRSKAYRYD